MTEILSILMLPVVFCMILFNMGDWILIVPPFIVAIIMFFAAGTNETVKGYNGYNISAFVCSWNSCILCA